MSASGRLACFNGVKGEGVLVVHGFLVLEESSVFTGTRRVPDGRRNQGVTKASYFSGSLPPFHPNVVV